MKPILVTGASSFLGAHLVRHLARDRRWPVIAVVNKTPLHLHRVDVQVVQADLTEPWTHPRRPLSAVVHMAMKVADPAANDAMLNTVLQLCRSSGARLLHGSTTQVTWDRRNAYADGRAREEQAIADSGLPHVILRPCAPYGPALPDHQPHHVESFHRLSDWVRRWPVVPVIGTGAQLRQPIHTRDWSDVVARFIEREEMPNRAYDCGGPVAYPFIRLVELMGQVLGRRVRTVKLPVRLFSVASVFVDGLNPDLMSTFTCDDVVDLQPLRTDLGKREWVRFEDGAYDLFSPWRFWRAQAGGPP